MKWSQMHPNTKKRTKRWGYDPMGWIGCICSKKFRCDFMSRTFALIAPLQSVLHCVYCLNETFPNPPERYETLKNMTLGSYGVDRVQSLWEITRLLRGKSFCIHAVVQPVLHWVYFRNKTISNAPKHYETHQNKSLWSYGVDWVCSLREILKRLCGTNICINCTSSAHFAPSFVE